MALTVKNTSTLVGHPYSLIRMFINDLRRLKVFTRPTFDKVWKDLKQSGEPPFEAMLEAGMMRLHQRGDNGATWTLNAKANAIGLKPLKRLTRQGLQQTMSEIMVRVHEAVTNQNLSVEVGRLYLFGSALDGDRPNYGDVDIAIEPITKAHFASRLDMVMRLYDNDEAGPREALYRFIRGKNAHIQIVEPWYLVGLGCESKIIYEVADIDARIEKDRSNIVSDETKLHVKFKK